MERFLHPGFQGFHVKGVDFHLKGYNAEQMTDYSTWWIR